MGEYEWFECCKSIRLDLLELYGSTYVIEHVTTEYNDRVERKVYRSYTTDMLKAIAESLGVSVIDRYADVISLEASDTRTGDEIAEDIIKRAGLRGK